ncbi:predicted protein, partial [Nematostella vectensis]
PGAYPGKAPGVLLVPWGVPRKGSWRVFGPLGRTRGRLLACYWSPGAYPGKAPG